MTDHELIKQLTEAASYPHANRLCDLLLFAASRIYELNSEIDYLDSAIEELG